MLDYFEKMPALTRAKREAAKTVCISNQHQTHVAMSVYGTDFNEFPSVLDWSTVDGSDLAANRGDNISDEQTGGLTVSRGWAYTGAPAIVLLRQQAYITSYVAMSCAAPPQSERKFYNRHMNGVDNVGGNQITPGFLYNILTADASLYTMYENPFGGSLAIRNHGCNPFDLYSDPAKGRSTSQRGWQFRDKRPPANFAWTTCPGRMESQGATRPESAYGGYGYEPHGSAPLSTLNPLFGGVSWAELWDRSSVHVVDRVVGFADGRVVYDHQVTPHNPANCPEWIP